MTGPQASLTTITGSVDQAVVAGGTYTVSVDHSGTKTFTFAEPPRITAVADVVMYVCADYTDGGHFRIQVVVSGAFAGYSPITISWSRVGW